MLIVTPEELAKWFASTASGVLKAKVAASGLTLAELAERTRSLQRCEAERFAKIDEYRLRLMFNPMDLEVWPLSVRECKSLAFVLWDRDRDAFEEEAGVVIGAYEMLLRIQRNSFDEFDYQIRVLTRPMYELEQQVHLRLEHYLARRLR